MKTETIDIRIEAAFALRPEIPALWAEARELLAEVRKLRAEAYKLRAEANKLLAEANKLWEPSFSFCTFNEAYFYFTEERHNEE